MLRSIAGAVHSVPLIKHRLSAVLATAAILAALVVAGCGSSPGSAKNPAGPSGGSTAQTQAPAPAQSGTSGSSAGIPQGNGGDQDADNNGGPSDGDGNI